MGSFDTFGWNGLELQRWGELDEWRGELCGLEVAVFREECGYWGASLRIRGLDFEGLEFRSSALAWRRSVALDRALERLRARVAGSVRLARTVRDSSLIATATTAEQVLRAMGSSPVTVRGHGSH